MLCNYGKLTDSKRRCCKHYIGRSYIMNDNIIEEHYCNNGFIYDLAETLTEFSLIDLNDRAIRTCSQYSPKETIKHKKKNKKAVEVKDNGVKNGK